MHILNNIKYTYNLNNILKKKNFSLDKVLVFS